jgi:hypothetical protein
LEAITVKVDDPPGLIALGFAEIVTVGAEALLTVTVAVAEALPPAPDAVAV